MLFKAPGSSHNLLYIDFVDLELPIRPILEVAPQRKIYEGDRLTITCLISNFLHSSESSHLYLSQGTQLLSNGDTKVNHSMIALAKDPGEFECKLEMGNVVKVDTKKISVTGKLSIQRPAFFQFKIALTISLWKLYLKGPKTDNMS